MFDSGLRKGSEKSASKVALQMLPIRAGGQPQEAMMGLFDRCIDPNLLVRRITVVANHIISENDIPADKDADQPDLFTDYEALEKQKAEEQAELDKEKRLQQAIIGIKNRMGKNAILKGTNFVEGATGKERNEQIGGHRK